MTKELEALSELKNKGFYYSRDGIDISTFVQMRLDTIETALKESEKALTFYKYCIKNKIDLAKLDQISNDYVAMPIEVWEEKLKKLAVLEIIVNKKVNVFWFLYSGDLETYNDIVENNRELTEEEYNLLKEVLL